MRDPNSQLRGAGVWHDDDNDCSRLSYIMSVELCVREIVRYLSLLFYQKTISRISVSEHFHIPHVNYATF